jgi:hypothetical protein
MVFIVNGRFYVTRGKKYDTLKLFSIFIVLNN